MIKMIGKKQAQETSFAKWHLLKNDFDKLFKRVHKTCGFCTYGLDRMGLENKNQCKICEKEFPEVAKVCSKMLHFFHDTRCYVETMINEVIDAIRLQKVDDV